ncbi:MAG: class I SAM-dependent methyltransferase [Gammaproteobacteria bacterium]
MNLFPTGEAQVVWRLLRGQPRSDDHRERLQGFYAPQARHYDAFREKLLAGRADLVERLCLAPGQHVVELGAGTARNLDFIPPGLRAGLGRIDVVDLCPALLDEARRRCRAWPNVHVHEDDAARFNPGGTVDRVLLSYALTMMPDWRATLRNAFRMLRPGGLVGVVDFSLPRAPNSDMPRWQQLFWRRWFAHDGVWLDPAHGAFLDGLFERITRIDRRHALPYVPLLKVPYYLYVGRK